SEMRTRWSVTRLGGWRSGLESDLVPEMFQAPDQAFVQHVAVLHIKEVRSAGLVADLACEKMGEDDQDRVRDSKEGLLGAAACGEPPGLGAEISGGPRGRVGSLQHELTHPGAALACGAVQLFASALGGAGTPPRPRRQALGAREPMHVRPDLGQDSF